MPELSALPELLRDALAEPLPSAAALGRAKAIMPGPLDAAWSALLSQARAFIAELALDTRARPALAGFRAGPGTGFQILYRSGQHEVFIEIKPPDGEGHFRLDAQIETGGAGVPGCPIVVARAGTPERLLELRSDPEGSFRLELPAGRYDLALGLDPPFVVAGVELE